MEGGGYASEGYGEEINPRSHTHIQMAVVRLSVVAAVGFSVLQFFMF